MTRKILITAETGSDMPKELAEELGVLLIPMHVSMGSETLDDGTFPPEDVCAYYDRTGKAGLNHWEWIGLAIKMQLFRLGKLEFRPNMLKEELVMDGQAYPVGSKVLEVWFPAEESLDDETVEETLAYGKDFFETYYRQEYELFLCHSSFYRSV